MFEIAARKSSQVRTLFPRGTGPSNPLTNTYLSCIVKCIFTLKYEVRGAKEENVSDSELVDLAKKPHTLVSVVGAEQQTQHKLELSCQHPVARCIHRLEDVCLFDSLSP